ncbi:SCAN domain-containing protein 3 [Trichinella britovi]|uniref:SCAN domain-containing protein 3 n=1 Tax=Trichinella britovi TaxID=45882 RepID=A0A0V1DES7_TRIBR|nr:SCAN domain-containing protein 3 [Trichinella britovi]
MDESTLPRNEALPNNLLTVSIDGAPAMVGCHRKFIAQLKNSATNVLAVHCVIHRQHLVAKHLTRRLHCSLGYAIATIINKIRSISFNDRLFSQLCEQNDEKFNRLLIYTEVRWLLKGVVFCDLFETFLEFFDNKEPSLRDSSEKFKSDIAYRNGTENLFQNPIRWLYFNTPSEPTGSTFIPSICRHFKCPGPESDFVSISAGCLSEGMYSTLTTPCLCSVRMKW